MLMQLQQLESMISSVLTTDMEARIRICAITQTACVTKAVLAMLIDHHTHIEQTLLCTMNSDRHTQPKTGASSQHQTLLVLDNCQLSQSAGCRNHVHMYSTPIHFGTECVPGLVDLVPGRSSRLQKS